MSAREKRAGAYMIRNRLNGKVYIGVTSNLQRRFGDYVREYNNYDPTNPKHYRTIIKVMHDVGWKNFEFKILEDDPKYFDPMYQSHREMELIAQYRSNDKRYGYNATAGGDVRRSRSGEPKTRIQLNLTPVKKGKKFISLFLYDTTDKSTTFIPFGAKYLGEKLNQSTMTIRWSIRNGALILDRYYIFEVNKTRRTEIYDYIKATRLNERGFAPGGNAQRAIDAFNKYEQAYFEVNEVAKLHGQ